MVETTRQFLTTIDRHVDLELITPTCARIRSRRDFVSVTAVGRYHAPDARGTIEKLAELFLGYQSLAVRANGLALLEDARERTLMEGERVEIRRIELNRTHLDGGFDRWRRQRRRLTCDWIQRPAPRCTASSMKQEVRQPPGRLRNFTIFCAFVAARSRDACEQSTVLEEIKESLRIIRRNTR